MAALQLDFTVFDVTPDYDDWVSTELQVSDDIHFQTLVDQDTLAAPIQTVSMDVPVETPLFIRARFHGQHGSSPWCTPYYCKVQTDPHYLIHIKGQGEYHFNQDMATDGTHVYHVAVRRHNQTFAYLGFGIVKTTTDGEVVSQVAIPIFTSSIQDILLRWIDSRLHLFFRYHNGTRQVLACIRLTSALTIDMSQVLDVPTGGFQIAVGKEGALVDQLFVAYRHSTVASTTIIDRLDTTGFLQRNTVNINSVLVTPGNVISRVSDNALVLTARSSSQFYYHVIGQSHAYSFPMGSTGSADCRFDDDENNNVLYAAWLENSQTLSMVAIDIDNNTVLWKRQIALNFPHTGVTVTVMADTFSIWIVLRASTHCVVFEIDVINTLGDVLRAIMFRSLVTSFGASLGKPQVFTTHLLIPLSGSDAAQGNPQLILEKGLTPDTIVDYPGFYTLVEIDAPTTTASAPSLTATAVTTPTFTTAWASATFTTESWSVDVTTNPI